MKAPEAEPIAARTRVAPLVGAWIERIELFAEQTEQKVAPLVGAWIESITLSITGFKWLSLLL